MKKLEVQLFLMKIVKIFMNKNFNHPLMYNNITSKDVSNLIHFLKIIKKNIHSIS